MTGVIHKCGLLISGMLISSLVAAEHFNGHVSVRVGALSEKAKQGQIVFNVSCARCHGVNGEGTLEGPPLIHEIYNPGHHGNQSFIQAVRAGVKQHHWPYGDMPPQPEIGFSDITHILKFIRETQKQNGITKQQHKM